MSLPNDSFVFPAQGLPQKLCQVSDETLTGYWLCEFVILERQRRVEQLYIALLQGQVVFSGQQLSWETLIKTLQNYIPRLRGKVIQDAMLALWQQAYREVTPQEIMPQDMHSTGLIELFDECYRLNLISHQEVVKALRLKILSDFDTYLFKYPGKAQFIPSLQLSNQAPIAGFDLEELLAEARQRQAWWNKLQAQIPSMSCIPVLNQRAMAAANLTPEQKQRLELLADSSKTLDEIAFTFAQDSLEIARVFTQLLQEGLVTLKPSSEALLPQLPSEPVPSVTATQRAAPAIFVVDDSPLLLKQFHSLVTRWGYQVQTSDDPESVVEKMLRVNPAIAFLDINLPGISGFDLVKQIRRCPEFATIPLIILTAEKTLTNNWRARWSGCRFLAKPLTADEVPQFQTELRLLLQEMLPLHSAQPPHPSVSREDSQYPLRNSS